MNGGVSATGGNFENIAARSTPFRPAATSGYTTRARVLSRACSRQFFTRF